MCVHMYVCVCVCVCVWMGGLMRVCVWGGGGVLCVCPVSASVSVCAYACVCVCAANVRVEACTWDVQCLLGGSTSMCQGVVCMCHVHACLCVCVCFALFAITLLEKDEGGWGGRTEERRERNLFIKMAFGFGCLIWHDTWVCSWSLFECFYVISCVRNLSCICCDSAIMPGEGGGLSQGERERQSLFQY